MNTPQKSGYRIWCRAVSRICSVCMPDLPPSQKSRRANSSLLQSTAFVYSPFPFLFRLLGKIKFRKPLLRRDTAAKGGWNKGILQPPVSTTNQKNEEVGIAYSVAADFQYSIWVHSNWHPFHLESISTWFHTNWSPSRLVPSLLRFLIWSARRLGTRLESSFIPDGIISENRRRFCCFTCKPTVTPIAAAACVQVFHHQFHVLSRIWNKTNLHLFASPQLVYDSVCLKNNIMHVTSD